MDGRGGAIFPPMEPRRETESTQRLHGLRVAITRGTTGLGLALVREVLGRGAAVAFVARDRERVERVAREHPGAYGIVGDVAKKDDVYPIALQITGRLGGLDVLVYMRQRMW